MFDGIKAKGEVFIQVFEGEKLIDTLHENNLVVTLGKTNLTKLLGGDAAGKPITKIGVGENGAAAVVGDNALQNMFSKALSNVTYPDAQSVLFHFDILNNEANGRTIREFGLLTSDNVLSARKVRGAEIVKTDVIRLVGTWKITVI